MITIHVSGLDKAIDDIDALNSKLDDAAHDIVNSLALIGYDVAYQIMAGNVYTGETIGSLTIVENDPTHYTLLADSKAILFFEFGAGVYGVGHPQAGEFGMGAGTYPNQTHALDPNGWWFPTDDPDLALHYDESGQGWGHSYGNPPHMPFYNAGLQIKADLEAVVREVFSSW